MQIEAGTFKKISYLVSYPDDYQPGQVCPLAIYLHGAGGRGDDVWKLKGFPLMAKREWGRKMPFIIFSPQCYADTWFEIFEQMLGVIDHARHLEGVDTSRVYLIGASMGGYACWQAAISRPEWFAAAVPICGGGMVWCGPRLKDVPVWAFHGALDPTVNVMESIQMVHSVNEFGGSAKLTIYPDLSHNSWDRALDTDELYDWLLSHQKQQKKEA